MLFFLGQAVFSTLVGEGDRGTEGNGRVLDERQERRLACFRSCHIFVAPDSSQGIKGVSLGCGDGCEKGKLSRRLVLFLRGATTTSAGRIRWQTWRLHEYSCSARLCYTGILWKSFHRPQLS